MKKSVNGKSFDEIFEERGKEVKNMVKGIAYLILCDDSDLWLFTFNGILNRKYSYIGCLTSLCHDGTCYTYTEDMGFEPSDFIKAFTATQNQIALLNAYKS